MTEKKTRRLGRADWLAQALGTLSREGAGALQVESLARSLGVTGGSFYWHFRDRQDLLDSVIDHWSMRMIGALTEFNAQVPGPTANRLLALMEDIVSNDRGRFDTAMRVWALSEGKAALAVHKVDEFRLDFLGGLFVEMGFDALEAAARARMVMYFHMSEARSPIKGSPEARLEVVRRVHRLLTQNAGREADTDTPL